MSTFLFKFFIRLASYFSVDKNWLDKQLQTEKGNTKNFKIPFKLRFNKNPKTQAAKD